MTCDHRLGYALAASPDFNGLACEYNRWWGEPLAADQPADACGQRAPRRWVDPTCMTKGDHEARERDVAAGRLNLPLFHVEQPGVLVFHDHVPDVISGMQGKALSAALAALREAELAAHEDAKRMHAKESRLGLLDFAPGGRAAAVPKLPEPSFQNGLLAHDPDWNDG